MNGTHLFVCGITVRRGRWPAPRLLFDVLIVLDITKVGESKKDWFLTGGSTLLHTGMSSFADISRHIVVHGTTGCDPHTCQHECAFVLFDTECR